MKEKETLMIIGAGVNQLPLIQTAKAAGYRLIVVGPAGDYPGFEYADEVFHEDIFHKDAIVDYARQRGIDGVISDQSDMIAPTVAYVAEKLGLPGFGYHNALCFTNKELMRETYVKAGIPVAPNRRALTAEEALAAAEAIGYPVIIKPQDSFSSRGVIRVNSAEEMRAKFDFAMSASRSGQVLVEKFLKGPQYFSQGFVNEYELTLFAFSDRYYFDIPDLFLPYTNAFPAKISEERKRQMAEQFGKVIALLRPRFGHVWAEWIVDEESGELYMVEMAIRGAGALVTTDVIPRAYGVDTQPCLIEAALGHKVEFPADQLQNRAAAFFCFLVPPGRVIQAEGVEELPKIKGVVKMDMRPIHVGDVMGPYKDKSSRFGPIVVEGETRDELDRIREEMMRTVKIRVMTPEGEKECIWE